jgi:hypothetical protein
MLTLLSDNYVPQPVTVSDLQIACIAWGFTIGFGFLTTWTAIKQTASMQRKYGYTKLNSPYIWMIWLEILVCLIFSVICWLHLNNVIPPRYVRRPRPIGNLSSCFAVLHFTSSSVSFHCSQETTEKRRSLTRDSYNLGASSPVSTSDHYQSGFNPPDRS